LITETFRETDDIARRPSSVFPDIRPRAVAGIGAILAVAFLTALLAPQRFELSALVNAGTSLSDSLSTPSSLTVIREGDGYDGQFSYRLALDPFTAERSANGMSLDLPAYRHQRILYPAIAWMLSFGQSTLLPSILALINVAAFVALAWLGAHYARLHGRRALWGLAIAAIPASIIALANDLGEILLMVCLVAAAIAMERGKPVATTLALSLAVLSHEHGILLVLAVALVTVSAPELRSRGWWLTWLIPLGLFVIWQIHLTTLWSEAPIRLSIGFLSGPFRGIVSIARQHITSHTVTDILQLAGFAFALALPAACLWALRTTGSHRAICMGWVFATALLFLGTGLVWEAELSFWRAAAVPLTLGALVLLGSRTWMAPLTLLAGSAFGIVSATRIVWTVWHG